MRRGVMLLGVGLLAAVMLYLSRFWFLSLWPRAGLFGLAELRPQGGLLGQWLRGTNAAPFELIIWVLGCFALLTLVQKIYDRLIASADEGETPDG